jgi:dolichol-phosphate mannosyltransferase
VRTQICIPTYLEAENIAEVLRRVRQAVPDADVLVIDDNSTDSTAELAEEVGRELGGINVLRRPAKEGLGPAYRAGFRHGFDRGYEVLVQMDADLSHDPAVLPELLAALDQGADLAVGSRYVPGGSVPHWPLHRRLLSRYANRYAGAILGIGIKDATAGYRAYRATALEAIDVESTRASGYGFQIELALRVARWGGKVTEIPIAFTDRVRGTSKMSGRIIAEAMLLVTWWGIRDRVRGRTRTRAAAQELAQRRSSS